MLPGFSSKYNNSFCLSSGGKKSKQKKRLSDNDEDDNMSDLLLNYNLEKMNEGEYDFSHCDIHRDTYPFASKLSKNSDSLFDIVNVPSSEPSSYDSDDDRDDHDNDDVNDVDNDVYQISLCIYQINTSCELPFLEFLMVRHQQPQEKQQQQQHGKKKVFEFPSFNYVSSKRKSVLQNAEEHVSEILSSHNNLSNEDYNDDGVVKFRGFFNNVSNNDPRSKKNIYLFFQKYFKKLKHPPQLSKRDDVWWIVTSEIVNFKKVTYMDIDYAAYNLFVKNPEIMHLYDCKGRLLETPTVCYYGDEFQKIKYLAFFGLLKAPVKSSFGPFYVATNFLSSMKYACYTHNQQPFELYDGEKITSGEYGKYKEGGVLRMILFIGKMKVFLKDGPPDDSQISQELAKTDESINKLMALRDSNGNWTEQYDTAYSGLYFVSLQNEGGDMNGGSKKDNTVAVNTVEWFFKNYNHSAVISYHNIDTTSIPGKYDVDYTDYKLK